MRRPQKKTPRYDEKKRSKATITAVLRAMVAFYLAYLGWTIGQNSGGPQTSMTPLVGWCICAVFTLVGIFFGVYTMRQYQQALRDAELPEEAEEAEKENAGRGDGEQGR